jgi:DNA-binding NarL/FixJ family response regulator
VADRTEAPFLREDTVNTNVANIAEKLAAHDCVQVAAAAYELGAYAHSLQSSR